MVDSGATPIRTHLLLAVLEFVRAARSIHGVRRIALIGSLATSKATPKDVDALVTIEDHADLASLAKAGRRMNGVAQSRNCGGDVFLADGAGEYIGRICSWRQCAPGIRIACRATHCGRRQFLHDDLQVLAIKRELIAQPPVELWPSMVRRVPLPPDVEALLIQPLESSAVGVRQSPAGG